MCGCIFFFFFTTGATTVAQKRLIAIKKSAGKEVERKSDRESEGGRGDNSRVLPLLVLCQQAKEKRKRWCAQGGETIISAAG